MTQSARPAPLAPGIRPWQNWNTLRRLWACFYLICALDALLLVTSITGAQIHREAMKGVGKNTLSIIHAQHIKSALADMDANLANELLGKSGQMQAEVKAYEDRRVEAATSLVEAAKNIFFEQEQPPIEALQVALGTYEALVQRARDLHDEDATTVADAYRETAKLMDGKLLPEADKLDHLNHDELEKLYDGLDGKSVASAFVVLVVGLTLLGILVAVQKFLSQRTHRTLNAALLAATFLTLGFVYFTFAGMAASRHRLSIAKEDAFSSIHALWQARATAYAAKADESRYLLDSTHAAEHEAAFLQKVQEGVKDGDNKVKRSVQALLSEAQRSLFPGEREAATLTQTRFADYLRVDSEIRRLQRTGRHEDALALAIGTALGDSNRTFDRFDLALDKTLKINQDAFDNAVKDGFARLYLFELKAALSALAIALLAFFGLLQRISEYR